VVKATILLIEDNPGDAKLVTEAIAQIAQDVGVVVAHDGEVGLTILRGLACSGELPDLIISNFNLPKLTGAQVLRTVQADSHLRKIPFIMLTSSARDEDREACRGAKAYLIKGSTWEDTLGIAKQIVAFLPPAPGNSALQGG
jgi:two-component system, chemotaxis family, response regulator Rcp1